MPDDNLNPTDEELQRLLDEQIEEDAPDTPPTSSTEEVALPDLEATPTVQEQTELPQAEPSGSTSRSTVSPPEIVPDGSAATQPPVLVFGPTEPPPSNASPMKVRDKTRTVPPPDIELEDFDDEPPRSLEEDFPLPEDFDASPGFPEEDDDIPPQSPRERVEARAAGRRRQRQSRMAGGSPELSGLQFDFGGDQSRGDQGLEQLTDAARQAQTTLDAMADLQAQMLEKLSQMTDHLAQMADANNAARYS